MKKVKSNWIVEQQWKVKKRLGYLQKKDGQDLKRKQKNRQKSIYILANYLD